MLRFQWNALRRGDPVLVHDTAERGFALRHGEVVIVDTVVGSTNDLAVRVGSDGDVIRPPRLAVHLDPLDSHEDCWRCDLSGRPLRASAPDASADAA